MKRSEVIRHSVRNLLQSVGWLAGMLVLLGSVGRWVMGDLGLTLALLAGLLLFGLNGKISPAWLLRTHRARLLTPREAPGIYRMSGELARRAGLSRAPTLFLVPSLQMNAFAVSSSGGPVIGLTRGLVSRLHRNELAAVLAHEIAHIAHRDLWILGIAATTQRLTRALAWVGQMVLVFFALPMVLTGHSQGVGLLPLFVLVFAPILSGLMQLALSRTREFEADLGAVRLTGDPEALISALHTIDPPITSWWRRLLRLPPSSSSSAWMTHPPTAERIARLRSLREPPSWPEEPRFEVHFPRHENLAYRLRPAAPRRIRLPHFLH